MIIVPSQVGASSKSGLFLLLLISISFAFSFFFNSVCCEFSPSFFAQLISLLLSFSSRPRQTVVRLGKMVLREGGSNTLKTDLQRLPSSWKSTPLFKNGNVSPLRCPLPAYENILLSFLSKMNYLYTVQSKTKTAYVAAKPYEWALQQHHGWKYRNGDDIIKSQAECTLWSMWEPLMVVKTKVLKYVLTPITLCTLGLSLFDWRFAILPFVRIQHWFSWNEYVRFS